MGLPMLGGSVLKIVKSISVCNECEERGIKRYTSFFGTRFCFLEQKQRQIRNSPKGARSGVHKSGMLAERTWKHLNVKKRREE